MTQTPTLARMVFYHPPEDPSLEGPARPLAAVIAKINDAIDAADGVVDLFVLKPGMDYVEGVPHAADPTPGFWSWPPRA